MSQATHTSTTTAPRPTRDPGHALSAIDAIHHAQRGVTALVIMASGGAHALEDAAVNFVADAIGAQLAIAEASLSGQGDAAATNSEPTAGTEDDGEGPTVEALYYEWRRASVEPAGGETDAEASARLTRGVDAERAMSATPSDSGYEIRFKLEVLADMLDVGQPVEPRWRVMVASIAGDVANLLS